MPAHLAMWLMTGRKAYVASAGASSVCVYTILDEALRRAAPEREAEAGEVRAESRADLRMSCIAQTGRSLARECRSRR